MARLTFNYDHFGIASNKLVISEAEGEAEGQDRVANPSSNKK